MNVRIGEKWHSVRKLAKLAWYAFLISATIVTLGIWVYGVVVNVMNTPS